MYHIKASYPHHRTVKSLYVSLLLYLQMVVLSRTRVYYHTRFMIVPCFAVLTLFSLITANFHNAASFTPPPLHHTVSNLKQDYQLVKIDFCMLRHRKPFSLIKAEQSVLYLSKEDRFDVSPQDLSGYPGSYNEAHGLCHT